MNAKLNSTENSLYELGFIFCGETNEVKVLEDCQIRVFEDILDIAQEYNMIVRVVKRYPICRVCKKPLNCNGTRSINLNKNVIVKVQKYIHTKCEKSSCISSLIKFKKKFCSYMRSICDKGIIRSLIGYPRIKTKKKLFMMNMSYVFHEILYYIMNKNIMMN